MREEPKRPDRDPGAPGEDPAGDEAGSGGEEFPAGVETDEGQRPGDKTADEQPGMAEDPPRTD